MPRLLCEAPDACLGCGPQQPCMKLDLQIERQVPNDLMQSSCEASLRMTAQSSPQPHPHPSCKVGKLEVKGHLDAQALQHVLNAASDKPHAVYHGGLAQRLQVPC